MVSVGTFTLLEQKVIGYYGIYGAFVIYLNNHVHLYFKKYIVCILKIDKDISYEARNTI